MSKDPHLERGCWGMGLRHTGQDGEEWTEKLLFARLDTAFIRIHFVDDQCMDLKITKKWELIDFNGYEKIDQEIFEDFLTEAILQRWPHFLSRWYYERKATVEEMHLMTTGALPQGFNQVCQFELCQKEFKSAQPAKYCSGKCRTAASRAKLKGVTADVTEDMP